MPDGRGITFCATLPRPRDSSLAREGIVLYAILQRLIERGLEPLAGARQIDAGPAASGLMAAAEPDGRWERVAGPAGGARKSAGLESAGSEEVV